MKDGTNSGDTILNCVIPFSLYLLGPAYFFASFSRLKFQSIKKILAAQGASGSFMPSDIYYFPALWIFA